MTRYYPLMLNIEDKKCIVVGGGNVALRKIESLLQYGAKVVAISPGFIEKIMEFKNIQLIPKNYESGDLEGAYLAFAVTDDEITNKKVYEEAIEKNIPVNIGDNPELCDFIVPSKVERGDLTIAISTNGKVPALCKKIRLELEEKYGHYYAEFLDLISGIRQSNLENIDDKEERKNLLEKLVNSDLLDKLKYSEADELRQEIDEIIQKHRTDK